MYNPELLACARFSLARRAVKEAFVPPGGGDPAAGGAPPGMDPAAMGGAPPGMDPAAMGGGAPPGMDPAAMGGGAPPAPPPMDPTAIQPLIDQAVQKALASQGGGGAAGAAGAGPTFKVKPEQIYQESVRNRKLLTVLLNHLNISLPPDILNDPSMTNDASVMGMDPTNPAGGATAPNGGGQGSSIQPMEAIQGASPQAAQGQSQGSEKGAAVLERGRDAGATPVERQTAMVLGLLAARRRAA